MCVPRTGRHGRGRDGETTLDHGQGANSASPPPGPGDGGGRAPLERTLRERFLCARCRYDLGGLSIREVCPECGLPIRATLLAVVDPHADQLRPLARPRLTAAGVVLWALSAFAAAGAIWGLRIAEIAETEFGVVLRWGALAPLSVALLALSAIGAMVLVRPHAGVARGQVAGSLIGLACYVPLVWCAWWGLVVLDGRVAQPFLGSDVMTPARVMTRLGFGLSAIGIVAGLRVPARALAARSVLVRSGRVGRQTMLAVAAAFGVAMLGDLCLLAASAGVGEPRGPEVTAAVGTVLIAIGSLLVTLGLWGVLVDTVRLVPVLARPPIGLGDVVIQPPAAREEPEA